MEARTIPPPGGDRNLGPVLLGVNWTVFTLSTLAVCLRLITRAWITRNLGWDDVTMAFTQMTNTVGLGFVMTEVANGLGRHRYYLAKPAYSKYAKYSYLDWLQVFITLALCKISICMFLLRLSSFNKLRRLLYALIAFLVVSTVPLTILMALQCRPVDKYWDTAVTGKCFSMATVEKIVIVQGVCSIITDVIGAAFPVVLLWNVKISIRTKVALCLLMGLGVITAVACVVRTSFSWQIKSNDVTWVGIPNALARMIEINLGIIAACAPVMRPLVRYIDARIAGKDTDQLFRKTSSPRIHSHWYTNLWTSRFASLPGSYATDAKSDPSSRRNLFHVAARKAHFNDTTMTTTETLDLPIQGIRKTTEFDVGEHEADAFESQRSLDAGMGTRWLVQHQV